MFQQSMDFSPGQSHGGGHADFGGRTMGSARFNESYSVGQQEPIQHKRRPVSDYDLTGILFDPVHRDNTARRELHIANNTLLQRGLLRTNATSAGNSIASGPLQQMDSPPLGAGEAGWAP